jgi:hypothetical protein
MAEYLEAFPPGTSRRFDVTVEGEAVPGLTDYSPQKCRAQTFPMLADVSDGHLDVKFFVRAGQPTIAALEIEGIVNEQD